jgi:hypothetical protein
VNGKFLVRGLGSDGGQFAIEDNASNFDSGYNYFNSFTGGNRGLKIFWDYPNNDTGRTTFLNCGQGGQGGFDFYQCYVNQRTPIQATLTCGSLGIGNSGPAYKLDVSGNARLGTYRGSYSNTSSNTQLFISGNATGTYASDSGQLIITGSSNSNLRLGLMVDTTNNVTKIQGGVSGSSTLPICLNSGGGNVGIGTTSPSSTLDVNGNTKITNSTSDVSSTPILSLTNSATSNNMSFVLNPSAGNYNPLVQGGDITITATPNGSEALTLCSNSNTTNGVRLTPTSALIGAGGTTSSPSSAVVTDASGVSIRPKLIFPDNTEQTTAFTYTTGSWTPSLNASGGGSVTTYTVRTGKYIVVNKLCTVQLELFVTNRGTLSGGLSINLPFTCDSQIPGSFTIGFISGLGTSINIVGFSAQCANNSNQINLYKRTSATSTAYVALDAVSDISANAFRITINGTYLIA